MKPQGLPTWARRAHDSQPHIAVGDARYGGHARLDGLFAAEGRAGLRSRTCPRRMDEQYRLVQLPGFLEAALAALRAQIHLEDSAKCCWTGSRLEDADARRPGHLRPGIPHLPCESGGPPVSRRVPSTLSRTAAT